MCAAAALLAAGARPWPSAPAGGPDKFGYTWAAEPFAWVDATSGLPLALAGDDAVSALTPLGFDFPYYENVYAGIYISTNGLITFGQPGDAPANGSLPEAGPPDNAAAVFWDDLAVGPPFNAGAVYTLSGGAAPNRYFVVEWHAVTRLSGAPSPPLTFQASLHENGDIVMQYHTLAGVLDSATVGLEDETATDGLTAVYNTAALASGEALRFTRPAPAARVKVHPPVFGAFAGPSTVARFEVPLRQAGDLGPDTFDLSLTAAWPTSLQGPAGAPPPADSDNDTLIDTGLLQPSERYTLTVLAWPPPGAPVGAHDLISLTVSSSLDPAVSQTVRLEAARPAPFAQAFQDAAEDGLRFLAVGAAAKTHSRLIPATGRDLALAAAADGRYLYAWRDQHCNMTCSAFIADIEFVLLDHDGLPLGPITRLTDHSAAAQSTFDLAPAVAGATDGRIGVAWVRREYSGLTQSRDNVYLAVLDANGSVAVPPLNVTQYATFGAADSEGIPRLANPRLAATTDNRFVVAWAAETLTPGGPTADIASAVFDSGGNTVAGPAGFTADAPGGDANTEPTLAALADGRVLLAYNAGYALAAGVLDSAGNIEQGETPLGVTGARPDAVQLAGGDVLLAWASGAQAHAALLEAAPLALASVPVTLAHPLAGGGEAHAAVTSAEDGKGVVTWLVTNDKAFYLYYALLDGAGAVVTPPSVLRWSPAGLDASREGAGLAPYTQAGLRRLWLPVLMRLP